MFGLLGGSATKLRMKPGLIFLLKLAWESRIRLPLLIMSGFMALGLRIQMEINIDRSSQFLPRLRFDDDGVVIADIEGLETYEDDTEESEEEETDEDSSWERDLNYETESDSSDDELYSTLQRNIRTFWPTPPASPQPSRCPASP